MEKLDGVLFTLSGLIDCRINERKELFALTDGSVTEADIKSRGDFASVTVKKADDGDKPLYIGKRRILP